MVPQLSTIINKFEHTTRELAQAKQSPGSKSTQQNADNTKISNETSHKHLSIKTTENQIVNKSYIVSTTT